MWLYILIVLAAFQQCSSEMSMPSFDLCKAGEALTSPNGRIYATLGKDCTRTILAPQGYRIEVNVTRKTYVGEKEPMFIYDGATIYNEHARISGRPANTHHVAISTSNAVLIRLDRVERSYTEIDITYKMFKQQQERCLCLPITHGDVVCSFTNSFYRFDLLYRRCTVNCGQDRFIANRNSLSHGNLEMQCFMGDPEHDTGDTVHEDGKWNAVRHGDSVVDDQLITCAKIFPTTAIKLGWKITYNNVTCNDLNETVFKEKIRQYMSSISTVSSIGQCFKSVNIQENINCTVDSVDITCANINGGSLQLTLIIRDNVVNSTNETIAFQRYFKLLVVYRGERQSLHTFFKTNLTVTNVQADEGSANVFLRQPQEDCPTNSEYKIDYFKSKYGCLNCPPHFYDNFTGIFPCKECANGTRRYASESNCVAGPRIYPEPSQKNCKHTCDVGKFYNSNSTICEWCPYGFYQNSTTAFNPECTPCPDGLSTGFVGATNVSQCIKLCPAGSYLKYTRCLTCDVGYFMPNASNRLPKCYKCPSGFTTLGTATTDGCVKKCSAGEYFNMTIGNCTLCPNNTYQDDVMDNNTRSCKRCPLNTVTGSTGASMLSDCLGSCGPGQYINIPLKNCSSCPQNTYQDKTRHLSFACTSCGPYKISLNAGSTNVSECIYKCSKGEFFNVTSKLCEKCPINMYQDDIGKDTCVVCEGNTFTLKTGSEQCISPCNVGEYLNKSAEGCQKCPRGFYQNQTDYVLDRCHPCPIDFYQDISGQGNCSACRDGTITLINSAASSTECIETCRPGYYLNKTIRSCEKCLKGFYQDENEYRYETCTECASTNLTTLQTGATSAEQCVGYCESFPCFNGAKCTNIDNDFNCTCPSYLTGKQCETVVDQSVADTMDVSIRFPALVWNDNLDNPDSNEYRQLAMRIATSIREVFENDTTFRTVKVTGFVQGSVIADIELNYVGGVEFTAPVDRLSSAVANGSLGGLTVDTSSVKVVNFTCSQPLGMENGRIPDSAITSDVSTSWHPPKNARLNNPGPGWAPTHFLGEVYLQVDFLEEVWLTGITTQGSSYDGGSWLTAYYINISSDGRIWSYYRGDYERRHIFLANKDVSTPVPNTLPYRVKTRYVRIFAYDFKEYFSFRVEFYGCPIPKTVSLPTQQPPNTRATNKPTFNVTTRSVDVTDNDDDGDNLYLIGVAFGIVAFIIIIVVVVVWWMKRQKHSHTFGSSVDAVQLKETR